MTTSITHQKRLEDCLAGVKPDQVPVALWRHFPVDDQTPEGLAAATINFQKTFDFDLVKMMPPSSYCIKDWGAQDEWRGSTEGTRDYTQRVIQEPEDWEKLRLLAPNEGHLGMQLRSVELIIKELGKETPVLLTIFNPLAQAKNLAGPEKLITHLRMYPDAVRIGLNRITETTQLYLEASIKSGIAGIFYAVQHAQYELLCEDEYINFGRKYDLEILQVCQDLWLNMLHLHGSSIMFDLFCDYPVQAINWHDQETPPSLVDAMKSFSGIVCGGVDRLQTLVLGTPERVRSEALAALDLTGGQKHILGTGCVVPIITPYGNIYSLRNSVLER